MTKNDAEFEKALKELVNRYGMDSAVEMSDRLIARFMVESLESLGRAVSQEKVATYTEAEVTTRGDWREDRVGEGIGMPETR